MHLIFKESKRKFLFDKKRDYLIPRSSFEHSQSKAPVSVFQAQSPLAFPKALHFILQKDLPPKAQVVSLFSRDPVF